jgi:hypothetical protein
MAVRCVVLVSALTLMLGTTVRAQRVVQGQVSAGGVAFHSDPLSNGNPWLAGWYVDAMQAIGWNTGFVAEASGFYGPEREFAGRQQWVAALVGLRQRIVHRAGANVSGQFLIGFGRWSQRRSGSAVHDLLTFQPGLVIDIPMDQRWSLRARADFRLGLDSTGFGKGGLSAGFGLTRYWGRR